MILDSNLIMSNKQAPTTIATHDASVIIDTVELGDAIDELYFVAQVNDAVTSAGTPTVNIKLLTDDNSAFGTADTLWELGATAKANLTKGKELAIMRLPKLGKVKRYLTAQIIIADAVLTAGSFSLFLAKDPQTNING